MMQPGHCWNINQMSTGYMDRFIYGAQNETYIED